MERIEGLKRDAEKASFLILKIEEEGIKSHLFLKIFNFGVFFYKFYSFFNMLVN